MVNDVLEQTQPPDPRLCPDHKALEQAIGNLKEQRAEDKKEIKDYITALGADLKKELSEVEDRLKERLDKGDAKFAAHNAELGKLSGWRQYILGGIALAAFLAWVLFQVLGATG